MGCGCFNGHVPHTCRRGLWVLHKAPLPTQDVFPTWEKSQVFNWFKCMNFRSLGSEVFISTFLPRLSNLWNQTGRYYSFSFYWVNLVEFKNACGGYFFPCKSPVLPRLGVDYYCFHDVDVAPQGETLKEFQSNLDIISDKLLSKQKETGVKLFLAQCF